MVGTALRAFAHPTIATLAALPSPDLGDNLPRRHLLALGDVDRGDDAIDAGLVDVLHLHRFQRQHRLTGGDAVARLDQDGNDAAVHGGTDLAVAAVACGRLWRGEREIGGNDRDPAALDVQPVAVAQEFRAVRHAVMAEADHVEIELVDLELVLPAVAANNVAAIAFAPEFELIPMACDLDLRR